MDGKTHQTSLHNILERISRLENEIRELRQNMLVYMQGDKLPILRTVSSPADVYESERVMSNADCWEVTCLGNFRLSITGRDIAPCHSRRGQSILKYLLASPRYAATSELLIECFWPEVDPDAGAHSLQAAVHTLRRSLRGCGPNGSDETVLFRNNHYFINPSLCIV